MGSLDAYFHSLKLVDGYNLFLSPYPLDTAILHESSPIEQLTRKYTIFTGN